MFRFSVISFHSGNLEGKFMINQYEPKPYEAMQYDGANEGDIQTWLEGFGYTVTISIATDDILSITISSIQLYLVVVPNYWVLYGVSQLTFEAISTTELNDRFNIIP